MEVFQAAGQRLFRVLARGGTAGHGRLHRLHRYDRVVERGRPPPICPRAGFSDDDLAARHLENSTRMGQTTREERFLVYDPMI